MKLIVLLESARAVWDMRAIITASPRIEQAGLDEIDLAADLGIDPDPEYDPFIYARGRLAVEATAARGECRWHSVSDEYRTRRSAGGGDPSTRNQRAQPRHEGRDLSKCELGETRECRIYATAELVAYNKRVREAFAAGVAAGTAAVPLDGRMIDVPVDEWAIVVIATSEACAARDAEKQAALHMLRAQA
jgi:citrate lyase beta subunit